MRSPVLEARDLNKRFAVGRPLYRQLLAPFAAGRRIRALEGLSFCVQSGEILGVVGPNGAGKTTLLRILAHLLEPDGGAVTVCGCALTGREHRIRGCIGYVSSDDRSFFWRLTGEQNLEFFACLYGVRRQDARNRMAALLKMFHIEKKATQLFRDYSTGTRKKFSLIRAMIHRPRVILLDEVTNSLDGPSVEHVKALVRQYVLAEPGRAAVWSTHRLEEIQQVCDKVLVIHKGRMKLLGPASELKSQWRQANEYFTDADGDDELTDSPRRAYVDGR